MDTQKRLEFQSMPDDLMTLAKDQFGPHFLQFEIWVGRVIDMAYEAGKAQRADVPREPTQAMLDAARRAHFGEEGTDAQIQLVWREMLDASRGNSDGSA